MVSSEQQAEEELLEERRLDELERLLGFQFKHRDVLREALTHTSWINERGIEGRDNERLEYLGDAVLELVAGEYLFKRFPNYDEGQLTQMRSSLVSTVALAKLGESLKLGEALRLGRGAAKSGARRLISLHANAFEALIGATFLDQGYRKAGAIFLSRVGDLSSWTDPNYKGRLQVLTQEHFNAPPVYRTAADGGARTRQYLSQVSVEGGPVLGEGRAASKQGAEQAAAKAAVDALVAPPPRRRRGRSRPVTQLPGAAQTEAQVEAVTELVSPESQAEAPSGTGRRHRRHSRSGAGTAEVKEQGPATATPAQEPVAEEPAAKAAPRRRRSRGRSAASSSAPSGEAQTLTPATPAQEPVAEEPAAKAAPRRHRGRGRSAASSSAPSGEAQSLTSATPAQEPVAEEPVAKAAPRRRRGRGRSAASSSAPSGEAQTLTSAAPDPESVAPSAEVGTAPAKRSRTHRGHRGGRRAGGVTAPET